VLAVTTPAAPRPFLMPDLVGKKGQEVSDVLRDVDLGRRPWCEDAVEIPCIGSMQSDSPITRTEPPAGAVVTPQARITLWVGPELAAVPTATAGN